jgi:hypothetical protein
MISMATPFHCEPMIHSTTLCKPFRSGGTFINTRGSAIAVFGSRDFDFLEAE